MNQPLKLIIADDHVLFIEGLRSLIQEEKDLLITAVANNGKELLDIIHREIPDIVLMDINMPVLDGIEATRYLKQAYKEVKIVILSTYNEDHLIEKAKQNGANGYLLKNSSKEDLLHTIRLVAQGQSSFPYRSPRIPDLFSENDSFLKQFNITGRELEIIKYIKEGHTNQQIADKLFLSIYTVETHRKNIMRKLNLTNPAQLMKFIIENNL
ncbi:MAG: response regulator transcription factor [Chitinophagaceae bacterium]|nr:response regulator transcription factor [Chitinophagaceae bacterium]